MNEKEKRLAVSMLRQAADEFSNHGCNDWCFPKDWTLEERQAFVRAYYTWNGNPGEYDPNFLHLPDCAVMAYLAQLLLMETV